MTQRKFPRQSEKHSSAAQREVKGTRGEIFAKGHEEKSGGSGRVLKGLIRKQQKRSPPRRTPLLAKRRIILRCGSGGGLLTWRRRCRFLPAHADKLRDARLLHGHAIKHAAHFHGLAVVGDDDELRLAAHLADQTREAPDVGFIERCVDFVKNAERTWLVAEDGNEQRQRGHGFFAAGEQQ